MIARPTLLILGAGASSTFGFPIGSSLAYKVCREFQESNSALRGLMQESGIFDDEMKAFVSAYQNADCGSLDEFTEGRGDFLSLVKTAIVCRLVNREIPDRLTPDFRAAMEKVEGYQSKDWCRYLLQHMHRGAPTPSQFADNRLRVITFNFDRSFEQRLFADVRDRYVVSAAEAAEVCRQFPVLHVHGRLGRLPWMEQDEDEGQECVREYAPTATIADRAACISHIRIIQEEIPTSRLDRARSYFEWAEQVCFLGFGYHASNLTRLRVNELLPQATIRGTALGYTAAETIPFTEGFLPNKIHLYPAYDALTFLRETDVLHRKQEKNQS